ncbi:MAG: A24 family peptidase [Methylocystis sp.]|uniref:A24 family peptidase n=1 Tax=Methylocystis sp. TaxID=1911079 RepID=UPI003DA26F61
MLQNLALILFPAMMAFAAVSDLLTMTIPNKISLVLVAAYFILAAWLGTPWDAVALHVGAGLCVLALTLLAYLPGWIGGGDAKLAAATALWIGWENLVDYGILASLAGGGVTLIVLAIGWLDFYEYFRAFPFARLLARKFNCVPYGIALAIGGLLIYPHTEMWRGLAAL